MSLIEFSTRRPVSVFIFAVAAVLFGVVAFKNLATDLLPDISYPSITIRTNLEGAAPTEVESLVTRQVENSVGVVNNVQRVVSSSRADVSEVTLEFRWGTDMDIAGLEVRERLDLLDLPADADRPVLLRYDPSLDPIQRLALTGSGDLIRLRRIAEEQVKRSLERIDGVAAAVVSGGLEEEIQIEMDERRLAGLALTPEIIVTRLAQENVNLTGGSLLDGQSEYLVRTINEFERASDLEQTVIEARDGAIVRLEDVASVRRGQKEREVITRVDGREAVEVALYKEGGTNTVAVADAVSVSLAPLVEQLQKVDASLQLTVITDQSGYIRQSIDEVKNTALIGGALAILVLFLFLRSWKTTGIIGIAIPLSVMATFFLMFASGTSLNIMSLGGLTLGIGLLVDNSIVVLEAIQRKRDEGLDDVEAARVGAGEVSRAVIASTLTTICVFVPIVFVEGIAGQLFGDQAITVTFSLVISLIVSLTVIPMLASRRFGADDGGKVARALTRPERQPGIWGAVVLPFRWFGYGLGRVLETLAVLIARLVRGVAWLISRLIGLITWIPLWIFDRVYRVIETTYDRALGFALRHPLPVVALAVVALVGSLQLYPRLGQELIPELVQGELYVETTLPPGTRLEVTERRLARLEQHASSLPGIKRVYAIAGSSNQQGGVAGERRENVGQLTLTLNPPVSREREEAVIAAMRVLLEREDSMTYRFSRPSYFSFRTPIELEIRGYNLTLLKQLSDTLTERMRQMEGLADVESSTEGGNPELQIDFDRERLASLGLSIQQAASTLRAKIQGEIATDIQRDDRTIDIRLRSAERFRNSASDLGAMTVFQASGTAIPLSAVATITERQGPAEIRRSEGDRVAVITANLIGRDLGSATEEISQAVDALDLPPGFDWAIGGQRQEMEVSFGSLRLAIGLAIFMVYLVMASQFESLLHPFVILFSVPFSIVGVLVTLVAFDVNISIVVLIGVVLLAGIVVNNAIILVDTTNQLRRSGLAKLDALRRAGKLRLRPILMTTATTVLGLLPMALGLGAGSELRSPMALPVIGGLLSSTVLTLLILPSVYTLLDRGR